ncbi:hypothetical protein D3C71_1484440 [compost metagenome]
MPSLYPLPIREGLQDRRLQRGSVSLGVILGHEVAKKHNIQINRRQTGQIALFIQMILIGNSASDQHGHSDDSDYDLCPV